MPDPVSYALEGNVAVITMDDGKANAAGFAMLEALNNAFDRAEQEASATVLLGRPGLLSGGFDLKVMRDGNSADRARLFGLGARFMMRMYGHPQPLIMGATGHAVALGGFFLLAADRGIGMTGDFRIGLNEVAISMTIPTFGILLTQARLDPRELTNSAMFATLYSPEEAVRVGFLDSHSAPEQHRADVLAEATRLAELPGESFAATKLSYRQPTIDAVLAELGGE